MTLNEKVDLKTIEQDLDKLEERIGKLGSLQYDDEYSLVKMMDNIYTVYNRLVLVLSPFFNIKDEDSFNRDFGTAYDNFKGMYIDKESNKIDPYRIEDLHINCNTVSHMLNRVCEHKGIKNIGKLDDIRRERPLWFQEDNQADLDLYAFFTNLNKGFAEIQNYAQLHAFLSGSEIHFNKISKKMEPYAEKRKELETFIKNSLLNKNSN